ncbi:MAG: hypothetical protein FJ011_19135 [Chloroflexi bacterium]|nr:hypothetical protein [Chloroflexota bacterium]
MKRFLSSVRVRLLLLVLLAVLPALGLTLYTGWEERQVAADHVQHDALQLAILASADQDLQIESTRQLLIGLARLPPVRQGDPATCSALFADLIKQYPLYANLIVVKPNGDLWCSATPFSGTVNYADRAWFPEVLHLASWLTEVVAPWQVRTAQAGIQLAVEVEAGLPPIAADADFLGQVLENLLDNAVKFSPGGGTVTVRAYVEDERRMTNDERPGPTDGGRWSLVVGRSSQGAIARPVVIAVSDQGVGIPRDKLQQIFRRFYQVNGGTTRQFGGVGIGLALCQTIVAAHGGRIWAESAGEGQGSTFYVALPVGGDGAAG